MKKFFIYFSFIAFLSCKKENGNPGGFQPSPNDPTEVDGIIRITKKVEYGPGFVRYNYEGADAIFYDTILPLNQWYYAHGMDAGTVSITQKPMYKIIEGIHMDSVFYSTTFYYDQYVYPLTISISGSSHFPKMDIIEKREEPIFNDYYKVPDTFYCDRSNSIALGSVKNFDNLQLIMETKINNVYVVVYYSNFKAPIDNIVLSKLQMDTIKQNLGSATTSSLFLTFNSKNFIEQGGKKFEILKKSQYYKEQIYFKH